MDSDSEYRGTIWGTPYSICPYFYSLDYPRAHEQHGESMPARGAQRIATLAPYDVLRREDILRAFTFTYEGIYLLKHAGSSGMPEADRYLAEDLETPRMLQLSSSA